MTQTWTKRRGGLAALFLLSACGLASSKDELRLSTDPDEKNADKAAGFVTQIATRPNRTSTYYLFVQNPKDEKETYTVQMLDASGKKLIAAGKITLESGKLGRVKLEKTAPPPAPKASVPAVPMAPPPPFVEPPPGVELTTKKSFNEELRLGFTLRLLDDKGKIVQNKEKKDVEVFIPILQTEGYLGAEASYTNVTATGKRSIEVVVKAKEALKDPPCDIGLNFPVQSTLKTDALRSGIYQRAIKTLNGSVRLFADDLPVIAQAKAEKTNVRFYVAADGMARAFIFDADFATETPLGKANLDRVERPAVRVLPFGPGVAAKKIDADSPDQLSGSFIAKPTDRLPIRIEVDNADAESVKGAQLAVRFNRSGTKDFTDADEVQILGSPFEIHAFVEPQGENDSIGITYRVSDWIHYLDTRSLRGAFELQAVLLDKNGKEPITIEVDKKKSSVLQSVELVLDDTKPETIVFADFPKTHIKGTLLQVKAKAMDKETNIRQAVFYLGQVGPDGKLPDVKVVGALTANGYWAGDLPIPDKKGVIDVGVQFINEAGIPASDTKKIELVDPPAPSGKIKGVVKLGELGQKGLVVSLRDGDNKEKGTTLTKDGGKFTFENVPPGTYRVVSAKPDSGVGTKGDSAVQVEVGKDSDVTISLARKP